MKHQRRSISVKSTKQRIITVKDSVHCLRLMLIQNSLLDARLVKTIRMKVLNNAMLIVRKSRIRTALMKMLSTSRMEARSMDLDSSVKKKNNKITKVIKIVISRE